MSDRSFELQKRSIEGTSKYDYFVVGISSATFAYFAKDFFPSSELGANQSTFLLLAIIFLALSALVGLKKISSHNKFLEKNGKYFDYQQYLAVYKKNSIEGGAGMNMLSGEIFTPQSSTVQAAALEAWLPTVEKSLTNHGIRIKIYSLARDLSLLVGYFFLAANKAIPFFGN